MELKALNNYFAQTLIEKEERDLNAVKQYCIEDGWIEDYYNIFLPLYKKYGWELIRDIGGIEWEWVRGDEYRVTYLNLDRLSTLIDWDEKKHKFVAC